MYGCESWTIKKTEHQRTDAFKLLCWRRLLRLPWTARIKPCNPKGNPPWIFIGRTDEAEATILGPPDAKSWLTGKDPDAGKDWRQEEKGATEDKMLGWHHWLNGHELQQTPGDGEGQESLVCCNPWVTKSQTQLSDWATTTRLLISDSDKTDVDNEVEKKAWFEWAWKMAGAKWRSRDETIVLREFKISIT